MGTKKLKLSGFWIHVHFIYEKLVYEKKYVALPEAIENADKLWKVRILKNQNISFYYQEMTLWERKEWNKYAKRMTAERKAEFRRIQMSHNKLHENIEGLRAHPPHQSFFTKNKEANEFMRAILKEKQ